MTRRLVLCAIATLVSACGTQTSESSEPELVPAPTPVVESIDAAPSESVGAATVVADASPLAVSIPDAAPAATVELETSRTWPFFAWDEARAYTYNLRRPGPGAKLRIYSESQKWSQNPTEGPTLTLAQAKTSLGLLAKTQGGLIVSKCPFPRHGIVFFQKGEPVGSISVCFECGDIMIWPAYSQDPDWEEKKSSRFAKLMKAYDRVFPKWERFFEHDLGLAKDWQKLPGLRSP